MDIFLIIALLLTMVILAVILFGKEELGHRMYKAVCAAGIGVFAVLGFKMLDNGQNASANQQILAV